MQSRFSIIVPTYNRPGQLLSLCLPAVSRLDYPRDLFEVLVIQDGGAILPESLFDPFRERVILRLLRQAHAGPAAARNLGAANAGGTYLAFIDDDCKPESDWLQKLASHLTVAPDCAVGGRTLNLLQGQPCPSATHLMVEYLYEHFNSQHGDAKFLATFNVTFPTEHFRALGGFDERFDGAGGEDRDFCRRWMVSGRRMTYADDVVVSHAHPMNLAAFLKQHFGYGRGAFKFHSGAGVGGVNGWEHLSFYLGLVAYPLSRFSGATAVLYAILLALSQGTTGLGCLWEYLLKYLSAGEALKALEKK